MNKIGSNAHRLIFIGGTPRSGTTLVQNMIDSHPRVLGGPEFLHLPDILEVRRKLHASIDREWIDLLCSCASVDKTIADVVENIFLPLADRYNKEFYSEKTPENILVFAELMELFPQAHFIQVVRDPRAILASMRQVRERAITKKMTPPGFTADYKKSVAFIKRCLEAGQRAAQKGGVLTVVYEQLVENPVLESKRICDHLGLEWHDAMLRPGEKEHLGHKAITEKSNNIWYDQKSYNRNLTTADKEKWRHQLSAWIQIRSGLDFAMLKFLREYGYKFSLWGTLRGHKFIDKIGMTLLFLGLGPAKLLSRAARKLRRRR